MAISGGGNVWDQTFIHKKLLLFNRKYIWFKFLIACHGLVNVYVYKETKNVTWDFFFQGKDNEFSRVNTSCVHGPAYVCNITDLQAYTRYAVRVVVVYRTGENSTSLPESFKTQGGC